MLRNIYLDGVGQRHRQKDVELAREVAANAGMHFTLLVEEATGRRHREDAFVPDAGMDVDAEAAVGPQGDEGLRLEIVAGPGHRHDEGLALDAARKTGRPRGGSCKAPAE